MYPSSETGDEEGSACGDAYVDHDAIRRESWLRVNRLDQIREVWNTRRKEYLSPDFGSDLT